jgi:uncharacterized damage-inducible protein DinB
VALAEQRLNSNHGRLIHAARNVPPELRETALPDSTWTARDLLAHVLAWQEEALGRLDGAAVRCLTGAEIDEWNALAHDRLRRLGWDEILARIEKAHERLRERLTEEPPNWFGACTFRHYTEHTRALLAVGQGGAGSPFQNPHALALAHDVERRSDHATQTAGVNPA